MYIASVSEIDEVTNKMILSRRRGGGRETHLEKAKVLDVEQTDPEAIVE
jgi:hypothetical protein